MKRLNPLQLRDLLLKARAWSIHEPALAALLETVFSSSALTAKQMNERLGLGRAGLGLGVRAGDSDGGPQMVGNVAVLPVFGVLQQRASWITRMLGWTATEQLEKDFKAALANDQVKAIVLYCDSPGGVAVGVDEVATTIFQGRKQKPIHGFVRGYCASAAYYLVSGAVKLTATPSSTVGSIGTIYMHVEYSKMLAEAGIAVNVIKHGERKGDGNPYEKLSPAARAALQQWVDAYGDQFDGAVARNRGITVADVKSKYGQGMAFLAPEAQQRGLIDAVGTWEQLLASLKTPAAPLPQPSQQLAVGPATHFLTDAPLAAGPTDFLESLDASGSVAAASAASTISQPPEKAAEASTAMKISARVRAALFARGLISAQDVEDSVCLVAIGAYFAARGEACPQANDKLDDDKVVAALFAITQPKQEGGAPPVAQPAGGTAPATNVQTAHNNEMAEAAKQQAEASVLARVKEITASGRMLGMTQEQIDAAVASGKSFEQVAADWAREIGKRDKPIQVGGANTHVTVGADGHDRFVADACLALQVRLDRVPAADQSRAGDANVQRLRHAPLLYFATQCLAAAGVRVPEFASPEEVFEIAFGMEGANNHVSANGYSPYNRPGSFPNLLSNLANKLLDTALELAGPTYQEWTGMWPGDLPDFKPAPLVNKSQHDELDLILDSEASKEFGLTEEMLSYMVLSRYSNKFGLTPVMAANDDLGAFDEGMLGLESAWQNTVNRLCLRLFTGNVKLLDTFDLFDDTNHGNDLTGAGSGPPSVTSWDVMQQKVSAQRGVGGTGYVRTPLAIALVPPKQWVPAIQTFASLQTLGEIKQAATDATINVFRGTATVVKEPELQAASNDVWYGLARPRGMFNATIVRAYFRGWGRNGRRQRWYDPDTKTWYFELEGRVGAAAKQYRLAVRNDGVA